MSLQVRETKVFYVVHRPDYPRRSGDYIWTPCPADVYYSKAQWERTLRRHGFRQNAKPNDRAFLESEKTVLEAVLDDMAAERVIYL